MTLLLNIAGSEWVIIILLVLILLFGSKRLPQVSRTLGKAMGEYEKAREMFRREIAEAMEPAMNMSRMPKITSPVATERQKLETIACSLGIGDFDRLTDEELRTLISKRIANQ